MTSTRRAALTHHPGAAPVGSIFVAFRLLSDGEGGWLDPEVAVGAIVPGSLSPDKATTRHAAEALASDGSPVAIVEIVPGVSTFAAFRLLPDGEGRWLDPEVEVGAIVRGSVSSDKAATRHAAEALASGGSPVAIVEIFPWLARRLVAVVGDEAPPLGHGQ